MIDLLMSVVGSAVVPGAGVVESVGGGGGGALLESFFVQRHYSSGGSQGGVEILGTVLIWVLILMSVVCWTVAVRSLRAHTKATISPTEVVHEIEGLVLAGDGAGALRVARGDSSGSDLAASVQAGLERLESGAPEDVALGATEQAAEAKTLARLRSIEVLNVLGGVSPMLGLFGTVYGMILAFTDIVEAGGTPDAVSLAAGIGTALTTTFWGLVVAVPALTAHALLRTRIEARTLESLEIASGIVTRVAHSRDEVARDGADA